MVQAIATLLNTLVQRVLFNHMTMFLLFLFASFYFMPPELATDLNTKTPAFFPDWFSFSAFGAIMFTCVCTMIWILLCRAVKAVWLRYSGKRALQKQDKAWEVIYQTFSEKELDIVMRLLGRSAAPLELRHSEERTLLVAKGVIVLKMFNPIMECYVLNPSFFSFMARRIQRG